MATATGWFYDETFLLHDTGPTHPERPDRLRSLVQAFNDARLPELLIQIEAEPASVQAIARVHALPYIQQIELLCKRAPAVADGGDTHVSAQSYEIARLASGGAIAACDAVMDGRVKRAFSAHRPPGHHAERGQAMGFCLFNHIAVAAEYLLAEYDIQRVAIVDFDVHHGNGTQHSFEDRADVLFISLHQDPRTLYPGTGYAEETGKGDGKGFTLNLPMPPGAGDAEYEKAFGDFVIPRLNKYEPQLLLISAGFDAMKEDPLAQIELTEAAFVSMTRALVGAANRHCEGRIVSLLEGGYDLSGLSRAAVAHVQALME